MAFSLRTVSDFIRYEHRLGVSCWKCRKWHQVDLEEMVLAGRGNRAISNLRFRCRDCGELGSKTVQVSDAMIAK